MRKNSLSTVRSRSSSTKKAGNLAAILIVIGKDKDRDKFLLKFILLSASQSMLKDEKSKNEFPLLCPVMMFLVSNTPRLILNLTEYSVHSREQGEGIDLDCECDPTPTWYTVTISINHFLLTINRSDKKNCQAQGKLSRPTINVQCQTSEMTLP